MTERGAQPAAAVELRVHGIGTHRPAEVLSNPLFVSGNDDAGVYGLPDPPGRPVRAFVWSRTNRRPVRRVLSGVLWYASLPFSLVNVAGFMGPGPESGWPARYLRFVVKTIGVTLTVTYALWLIALISDEGAKYAATRVPYWIFRWGGMAVALAPFIIGFLRRIARAPWRIRRPTDDEAAADPRFWTEEPTRTLCVAHLLALGGVLAFVFSYDTYEKEIDVLFWGGVAQMGLLLLLGLPIWIASLRDRARPAFAAVVACGTAIALTQVFLSSARLAVTWILQYLDTFGLLPFLNRRAHLGAEAWPRTILPPFYTRSGISNFVDTVAFFFFWGLIIVFLGLIALRVLSGRPLSR